MAVVAILSSARGLMATKNQWSLSHETGKGKDHKKNIVVYKTLWGVRGAAVG
jgi:hypothetical protein